MMVLLETDDVEPTTTANCQEEITMIHQLQRKNWTRVIWMLHLVHLILDLLKHLNFCSHCHLVEKSLNWEQGHRHGISCCSNFISIQTSLAVKQQMASKPKDVGLSKKSSRKRKDNGKKKIHSTLSSDKTPC